MVPDRQLLRTMRHALLVALLSFLVSCQPVHLSSANEPPCASDSVTLRLKHVVTHQLQAIIGQSDGTVSEACRQAVRLIETDSQSTPDSTRHPTDAMIRVGYNMTGYADCLQLGSRYVRLLIDSAYGDKSDVVYTATAVHASVCLPHACSDDDVHRLFASQAVRHSLDPCQLKVLSSESTIDPLSLTRIQSACLFVIFIMIALCIASSFLQYSVGKSSVAQLLQPFDAVANMRHLLSANEYPDSPLLSLNLFRVFIITSAMGNHVMFGMHGTFDLQRIQAMLPLIASLSPSGQQLFRSYIRGMPSASTGVIVIIAAFTALTWMPIMMRASQEKKKQVTFASFMLHAIGRSLPLTVAYLLLIQCMPLISHAHLGPSVKAGFTAYAESCQRNGWRDLLFIGNWTGHMSNICLPLTWVLCVDVQLHALFYFLMTLLAKYAKSSTTILSLAVAAGIAISGAFFHHNHISPMLSTREQDIASVQGMVPALFYHTLNYVSAFAVGLWLGIKLMPAVAHGRRSAMEQRPVWKSVVILLIVSSLPNLLYDEENRFIFGASCEMVFASVIRSATAAALAYVLLSMVSAGSPTVNSLARSRIMTVLARVSFSWYYAHDAIVALLITMREDASLSLAQLGTEYLCVVAWSLPFAGLLFVFVEMPFAQLLSTRQDLGQVIASPKRE